MAPRAAEFITGNANKLVEARAILGGVVDLRSRPLDLVETQGTIDEISADKCRRAAAVVSQPGAHSPSTIPRWLLGSRWVASVCGGDAG